MRKKIFTINMMNISSLTTLDSVDNCECTDNDIWTYVAGITTFLALVSEVLPFLKTSGCNGVLHAFTSDCFKRKSEKESEDVEVEFDEV